MADYAGCDVLHQSKESHLTVVKFLFMIPVLSVILCLLWPQWQLLFCYKLQLQGTSTSDASKCVEILDKNVATQKYVVQLNSLIFINQIATTTTRYDTKSQFCVLQLEKIAFLIRRKIRFFANIFSCLLSNLYFCRIV